MSWVHAVTRRLTQWTEILKPLLPSFSSHLPHHFPTYYSDNFSFTLKGTLLSAELSAELKRLPHFLSCCCFLLLHLAHILVHRIAEWTRNCAWCWGRSDEKSRCIWPLSFWSLHLRMGERKKRKLVMDNYKLTIWCQRARLYFFSFPVNT